MRKEACGGGLGKRLAVAQARIGLVIDSLTRGIDSETRGDPAGAGRESQVTTHNPLTDWPLGPALILTPTYPARSSCPPVTRGTQRAT